MNGFEAKKNGGGLLARANKRLAAHDDRRMERCILKCNCAVKDRPFNAVFVRSRHDPEDRKFRFKQILRGNGNGSNGNGVSAEMTAIDISDFSLSSLHCPHCDTDHSAKWIHCGFCGTFVCGGRSGRKSEGYYFRCCDSCGNEGPTYTLKKVETYKPAGPLQLTKDSPLLRITNQR